MILWWYVTPSSTGMGEVHVPRIAQVLRLRMASLFLLLAATRRHLQSCGSRTRHQSELAHTSHLRRKCAARRVWEDMFGPCTERCDVGFCFVFDMEMFGPCTERCDVGFCFVFDMVQHWRGWRVAMSDFASSLTWRCLVHAWRDATSDFAWRCLVRERRVAMSDFASSLTWYSIGVSGWRKESEYGGYGPASNIHARRDAICRGFSSSLLELVTARHTLRGAMAQYAEIHARRNVMEW